MEIGIAQNLLPVRVTSQALNRTLPPLPPSPSSSPPSTPPSTHSRSTCSANDTPCSREASTYTHLTHSRHSDSTCSSSSLHFPPTGSSSTRRRTPVSSPPQRHTTTHSIVPVPRPVSNATPLSNPHSHSCCCTGATDTTVSGERTPHEADSSLPSTRCSTLLVGDSLHRTLSHTRHRSEAEDTNTSTTCLESLLPLSLLSLAHQRNDPPFAQTRTEKASGGETRVGTDLAPPPPTTASTRSVALNS